MEFEFILPRNTKLKKQNMVINSNDRFHRQAQAVMTRRIKALAMYEVTAAEDTFEIFDEETCNWVEHKGCEVYVRDCCYKVLNSYEEFLELFGR